MVIETSEINIPFPKSYWVEPGRFLAGAYPGSADPVEMTAKLTGLVSLGIDMVINLMEATEQDSAGKPYVSYMGELKKLARQSGYDLEILRFPVRDQHVPTRHSLKNILDTIDQALARGGRVYVHCAGGRGRTGTVVGCYLLRRELATPDNVLEMISVLSNPSGNGNGPVLETPKQEHVVLTWKEELQPGRGQPQPKAGSGTGLAVPSGPRPGAGEAINGQTGRKHNLAQGASVLNRQHPEVTGNRLLFFIILQNRLIIVLNH